MSKPKTVDQQEDSYEDAKVESSDDNKSHEELDLKQLKNSIMRDDKSG